MNYYRKIILIGIMFLGVGIVGCESSTISRDEKYSYLNENSNGTMAENEDGYFFVLENFLYYADKGNIQQWVVVCNKPECFHEDDTCNGYILSNATFWQKNNKFYVIETDIREELLYISEITGDGSGLKKVYEIPTESFPSGMAFATFQDKFIIRYNYINENGFLQEQIICLEDDENGKVNISTLYKDVANQASLLISGNNYWAIRGEDLVITTHQLEEGKIALENLCKINEQKIESLNLPNDVSLYGGYFADNIFTYYKSQEGFYRYNINTGEEKLILENQLEDGQGYVLSKDFMIECNRYRDYTPKEAQLKFYNGQEWIDIEVPEELAKSDDAFYPVGIASDRIFFRRNVTESKYTSVIGSYLYYIMLEEDNPKLVLAGKVGKKEVVKEEDSTEEKKDDVFANFKEVTIFDTEEYLFMATDIYLDYSNRCCVDFYFENRSDDIAYRIRANQCTINGIQCNTLWGEELDAGKSETYTLRFTDDMVYTSRVSEVYSSSEYTDIGILFEISPPGTNQGREEKIVHLYPCGEENAIVFTREPKDTDTILVENEQVSVVVTEYEDRFVSNDTMNVLIENKTEHSILIKVEEASANGIAITPNVYYGLYWTIVNPGAKVLYPMTLFDEGEMTASEGPNRLDPENEFFIEHNITSIETIEMKLKIAEYSYRGAGEDIVYETFVLEPVSDEICETYKTMPKEYCEFPFLMQV